jgi:hypothetical protein
MIPNTTNPTIRRARQVIFLREYLFYTISLNHFEPSNDIS